MATFKRIKLKIPGIFQFQICRSNYGWKWEKGILSVYWWKYKNQTRYHEVDKEFRKYSHRVWLLRFITKVYKRQEKWVDFKSF